MILLALQVAGWLCALLLLWRWPSPRPAAYDASADELVSVVIPARDEASRLPLLLGSLALQDRPPHEVLVVDDGSTDRTAEVAAAHGATVVRTDGPPAGWTGKTWACHVGTERATGRVLVLLDADTWLAPDGLRRLVAAHDELPNGLLSVEPFHETRSSAEQLSAVCNVVSVLGAGVAAPGSAHRSAGVAFGPCLVTNRDSLRAVGGFEAVRSDVVEDVGLAAAYRGAGRPVRCLGGRGAVSFRMYDGVGPLWDGWTKNLADGAGRAPRWSSLGAALWVAGAAAAAATLVLGPSTAAAAAYVAFAAQLAWMLRRLGRFAWWAAVAYPVPLVAFIVLFLVSAARRLVLGRVRWRGRDVPVRVP